MTLAVVASHGVRNLQFDVIGSLLQWELDGDSLGSYPEYAWLIPDSLPDLSSDRQTN